jgi:hypothetical protein
MRLLSWLAAGWMWVEESNSLRPYRKYAVRAAILAYLRLEVKKALCFQYQTGESDVV